MRDRAWRGKTWRLFPDAPPGNGTRKPLKKLNLCPESGTRWGYLRRKRPGRAVRRRFPTIFIAPCGIAGGKFSSGCANRRPGKGAASHWKRSIQTGECYGLRKPGSTRSGVRDHEGLGRLRWSRPSLRRDSRAGPNEGQCSQGSVPQRHPPESGDPDLRPNKRSWVIMLHDLDPRFRGHDSVGSCGCDRFWRPND